MDESLRAKLDNSYSDDREVQGKAYRELQEETEMPVGWAYEAWDELVIGLKHKDNHVRSITAQLLCNLARSDPEKRMLKDLRALLAVTKDERFVTARHTLQALWKVGLAGQEQRQRLLEGLERRFEECAAEKNCTLIRYDIQEGLRNLYDVVGDEKIKARALALIETEGDAKYRKKYASVWRVK